MRKLLIFGKELTQGAHYVGGKMHHLCWIFIYLISFLQRMHQPSADMSNWLHKRGGAGLENAEKGRKLLPSWKLIYYNIYNIWYIIYIIIYYNGRKLPPSWKGQDCFCEGEAPWQVGRLDYLELVNFVFPTNSSQHRPVFLDAKSKLFITFHDFSFYGTASFGYSSNFRFKIGH